MKNGIFNGFITATVFSLTAALSNHVAAGPNVEEVGADGIAKVCSEQVQLGTLPSLDVAKTERVIVSGVIDAIHTRDVEVNIQAHNRAEAQYERQNASDPLPVPQFTALYQSVAMAW